MPELRLLSCLCASAMALAASAEAQTAPGVIVAEAARRNFPLTVEALGTARANESVELRSKITETVRAIRFVEGARVEAGAVLVELDDASARAAMASAEANYADSQSKYRRGQELFQSKLLPDSELESLQARRDADRALLDSQQVRLAETVVRAPFAGRVGLRRVSVGSLVTPTTVIATLDDTETIKIDFDVPETAMSLIQPNATVIARSAAWPDRRFLGRVETVDTRVDAVSRSVTVRARVPNDEQLLLPGMFLTVELKHDDKTAVMIPEQATVPDRNRQFVLVVDDDGLVEKRPVGIGRRRPGQVEIVEGLEAGEVVVVEGTQKAQPGGSVEIVGRIELDP